MTIQIRNGTVYDPKNGLEGEKVDIFVDDGKIVDEIKPDEIIDATDKTVMAGGIDVHSHVATYGLNLARFTFGFPSVGEIGYTYAQMGYTHVNEPLMTLNTASYVHHELSRLEQCLTNIFRTSRGRSRRSTMLSPGSLPFLRRSSTFSISRDSYSISGNPIVAAILFNVSLCICKAIEYFL